ncbi:MAG: NAD-glutamate dehydrogenase domain-containing protein, partial [Hyphomicrobiaceae bacterium]
MLEEILGLMSATPAPADGRSIFARLVLDSAGSVDNELLSPEILAQCTSDAFAFITELPPTGRKVRVKTIAQPTNSGTAPDRHLTIIDVVNPDMPFLVDSVMGEIQARDFEVHLVSHPTFKTVRDGDGKLSAIIGAGDSAWSRSQESYIQVLLDPIGGDEARDLEAALAVILEEVGQVVGDWRVMLDRLNTMIQDYEQRPPPVSEVELAESIAFLRWLADGNFTLLGVREFTLEGGAETGDLVPQGGLGILRNPDVRVLRRGKELVHLTPEVRRFYFQPAPLIVTKANVVAKVHRRTHMDYIGAKIYGDDGRLSGELRIVGLFTSTAYNQSVKRIPLLRKKAEKVSEGFGHPPDSHSGKALANVLETFPRDELFQISQTDLEVWAQGILDLALRPRTRVFSRIDEFDRFVSALVFIPRDRYTTAIRQRIGDYLKDAYRGRASAFVPSFGRGSLVRVLFIIGRDTGETPIIPRAELEKNVRAIVRSWSDDLADAITERFSENESHRLIQRYATAFAAGYSENFTPHRAIEDISRIELLSPDNPVAVDFYRQEGMPSHVVHVALYRLDESIPLSRRVPILENLGFSVIDERSYTLKPVFDSERRVVKLHDMVLETPGGEALDLATHMERLEACFLAVWNGQADNDHFNRLIKSAGLDWREAAIARALAAYIRQIRVPYGQRYISDTLVQHLDITGYLFDMFKARFDPNNGLSIAERDVAANELAAKVRTALADVPSLDEDRILRQYMNLLQVTLRTNFYNTDDAGNPPETVSFKLDSPRVENA